MSLHLRQNIPKSATGIFLIRNSLDISERFCYNYISGNTEGGIGLSGFDDFLGNKTLIERIKSDIAASSLSHAYIIEGAEGSGKRTLAKLICAAVACREADRPCMKCLSCDKIMRDQSPDVIYVEADDGKVQLGVDVIRRLRENAVFGANDLEVKSYIFPAADTMNAQAQNALLKLLEEPPDGILFLLLCENAENLLPTIRSRAPICRLEALPDEMISDWLIKNDETAKNLVGSDREAFDVAVRMAAGSLGRAIKLCDKKRAEECLKSWRAAETYLKLLAGRSKPGGELAFYDYATKLATSKQRNELSEIYQLLSAAVRDLLASKLTKSFRPEFFVSENDAAALANNYTNQKLTRLFDIFNTAADDLGRNINLQLSQSRTAMLAMSAAAGR